jgi:hypothetical protein
MFKGQTMSKKSETSPSAVSNAKGHPLHTVLSRNDAIRGYQPKITGPQPVLHPPIGIGNVQPAAASPVTAPNTAKGTVK